MSSDLPPGGTHNVVSNHIISSQGTALAPPPTYGLAISPRRPRNDPTRSDVIDLMGPGIKSTELINFYRIHGKWPQRATNNIDIDFQFVILKHVGGKHEHHSLYRSAHPADQCGTMHQLVIIARKEQDIAHYCAGIPEAPGDTEIKYSFCLCYSHGHNQGRAITASNNNSVQRWFTEQVEHGNHSTPRINIYYVHKYP